MLPFSIYPQDYRTPLLIVTMHVQSYYFNEHGEPEVTHVHRSR